MLKLLWILCALKTSSHWDPLTLMISSLVVPPNLQGVHQSRWPVLAGVLVGDGASMGNRPSEPRGSVGRLWTAFAPKGRAIS